MNQVSANKTGLALGGLLGLMHAVWALAVLMGMAKPFLDWIFGLHFLNFQYSIDPFSWGNALLLVVVTAVIGYVVGYVFGWLWNLAHRAGRA